MYEQIFALIESNFSGRSDDQITLYQMQKNLKELRAWKLF